MNEQAGIYAGDEGYDINVNKHTDLKGALITSTQKAEEDGKNHFSTSSLTHSDIENHSNYSGSSFGVSGSVSANFETPFGENGAAQSTKQATDKDGNLLYTDKNGNTTVNSKGVDGQENTKKLAEGKESLQFSYGMGYGKDSDSQSSTTKSGINTQNITIKDEAEQLKRTGKTVQEEIAAIKTEITTESAQSQSGKLENRFNKDDVQKELDFQREVTEKFGPNVVEAGSLLANKFGEEAKAKRHEAAIALEEAEKAKAENNNEINQALVEQARDNFETASREAKEWETGGSQRLVIDSALNVISTALAGRPAAEVVASGLSPAVNNQIKKATTDAKGNVNTALNLTAHALWGAVEAYSANQNAAAGAGGALASEVMADVIAKELYGKKPNQLNREEKEVVSSVSQAAGALVGGVAANSSQGIGVGLTTAKNAVENNLLSKQDDEIVYHLSEKLRKKGYLTKAEQELLANKLLRDSFVDKLLLDYQENSNKLSDTQKKTLTDEIHRIASSYGISADVLFKRDLRNIIKRDDTEAITYLSRNNNFERQFMYTSQDAWETVPAIGMGINIAGKAIGVAPKLVTTMEKYPLLTEMGVTAITNTAYQLTNKNTYDPYDLLKAEMSTVLSKDKKLWQQAYLNAGLNVLSTKDPNDYGWSALAGVTGTVASKMAGNTKNISIIRNTSPVISGVASEYYGDSDRLKEWYKRAEEKYAK